MNFVRRTFAARALATAMALASIVSIRPVSADPSDIFSIGAPTIGSPAPKEADQNIGDASVSPTGAFQYSYPIKVAPGRAGMQPALSLNYSSQAAIYGTVAAGWSLGGLHVISLDTSDGRMIYQPPSSVAKRYTSSMAGGRPLVPVIEPTSSGVAETLRAQNDTSWTRYERMLAGSAFRWRAYSTDGTTYYFGDSDHVSCSIVSDEWAPITRAIDKFGNAIEYYWKTGPESECRIDYITWGQNANAAVAYFAAAVFNFTEVPLCGGIPVGSQISFRTGTKIATGASRLSSITIGAFAPGTGAAPTQVIPTTPDHTRVVTLGYDASTEACNAGRGAYRSLASIQESAWNSDPASRVDLPAVLFSYGPSSFGQSTLAWQPTNWGNGSTFTPWSVSPTVPTEAGARYNLGWGYRFSGQQWPTVEAMMLDVDGDGRLDRLTNSPQFDSSSHVLRCGAQWERNQGFNQPFAPPKSIDMPTIKWATPAGTAAYQGGRWAGDNPTYGANQAGDRMELCALNYQLSGYVNSFGNSGGERCPLGEACDASTNWRCSSTGDDCSDKTAPAPKTILAYRWMDIDGDQRIDLVASPVEGGLTRYNLLHGNLFDAPWEPTTFGPLASWACPATSYSAYPNDAQRPYTRCGSMFPYFVYKNHGNGVFGIPQGAGVSPLPDQILHEPVPLETTTGDSSITSLPVGQYQGTADLDGDGYLDTARIRATTLEWEVYRNGQDSVANVGRFLPASGTTPYFYDAAINLSLSLFDYPAFGAPVVQKQGMLDINGDGLADHWFLETDGTTTLRRNSGIGFGVPPITISQRPGSDGLMSVSQALGQFAAVGSRIDKQRTLDVDSDGRVDVLRDPLGYSTLQVYFNQGGDFSGAAGTIAPQTTTEHRISVSDSIDYYWPASPYMYSWEARSDLLDIDGDGIPEGFSFGQADTNPSTMELWRIPTPTQPPRLLVGINNQRGATTAISYAPTTNPNIVVQDTLAGKTMPHSQWVVSSQTTNDTLDTPATASSMSYKYFYPRFAPDDQGRYGLRGFERIDTTLPSNGIREDRYDFTVDWSGRIATSVLHPAESPNEARTIDITTWEERQLFVNSVPGNVIKTYHPTVREHFICANGQTSSTCTAATAAGYTKTSSTLKDMVSTSPGGGPTLMWQEISSLVQSGPVVADGDRRFDVDYALAADGTNYRLVQTAESKFHRVSGAFAMFAKSATTWTDTGDTSFRVPYTEEVWNDAVDANRAITRRAFDLQTGNVTATWKPVQWAANSNTATNLTRTVLQYDSRKLFTATETNEVGHVRDFTWEYGTGTRLRTQGPNVPPCVLGPPYPACPSGAPLKEEHRIKVDGLGRMTERYEVFGNPGENSYRTYLVETNAFIDGPAASVTNQSAIDHNESTQIVRYKKTSSDLDGHGRVVKEIAFASSASLPSATDNHVTRYVYANSGALIEVKVPDPSANDASTVSYFYTFDSLGRPLSIRRPDATLAADKSGVDMSYNGLTTTTSEVVGVALGQSAVTSTRNDAYGRLVQVDEQTAASPVTWATTLYSYSPDDNIKQITDPQGGVTTLVHDFAGRRTQITRNGRTWNYGYDRNDNAISETPPCTGTGCEASYISTTAYDALDRPISKLNAPRSLSIGDLALFGSSSETFTWDGGWNGKGRLAQWQSFAPGASTATTASTMTWNVQGQPMQNQDTFSGAGLTNNQRSQLRLYAISGQLSAEYLGGVIGTTTCTDGSYAEHYFDNRGLPSHMVVNTCLYGASPPFSWVTNNRNVAGLVTERYSSAGNGPFTFVNSTWTFDKLGRVTSQTAVKGSPAVQVVKQSLTYFGNDDPKTLDHYLGATNHKLFTFGYDKRHQLTSVAESALPNAFTATYTYGAAGRFVTAVESAAALPNSDVKARNVTYLYSGTDPERLTALRKNPGTKNLADYTYDEPGNQLTRSYPDTKELWESVYDGKDQLRRVTKKVNGLVQGSEEYWYDKDGTRNTVVKRNASNAVTEVIGFLLGSEVHYSPTGTATRAFNHVALGTTAVRLDRSSDAAASVEYQFQGLGDHLIAGVNQADGAINASFMYAPFGEIVEATNAGGTTKGIAAHRRRMNDKYVDEISDLGYYGFRYYDKLSMIWTQGDPLYRFAPDAAWVSPREAGLYTMSLNNPLRYLDPDGRSSVATWEAFIDGTVELAEGVGVTVGLTVGMLGAAAGGGIFLAATQAPEGFSPVSVKFEGAYDRWQQNKIDETIEARQTQILSEQFERTVPVTETLDVPQRDYGGAMRPPRAAQTSAGDRKKKASETSDSKKKPNKATNSDDKKKKRQKAKSPTTSCPNCGAPAGHLWKKPGESPPGQCASCFEKKWGESTDTAE